MGRGKRNTKHKNSFLDSLWVEAWTKVQYNQEKKGVEKVLLGYYCIRMVNYWFPQNLIEVIASLLNFYWAIAVQQINIWHLVSHVSVSRNEPEMI